MRFSYEVYNDKGTLVTTKPTLRSARKVAEKHRGYINVGRLVYKQINGIWSAEVKA